MKKSEVHKYQCFLIVVLIFLLSGCASLDKARSLHQAGKDAEALEMAQKYLDDGEDTGVRIAAANLIGKIGGNRAGEILMPVLDDAVIPVKNAAIRNIGVIKYSPASEKLIDIAIDAKGETIEELGKAIRKIGTPATDLLAKKYSSSGNSGNREKYKELILEVGPSMTENIIKNLAGKSYFENRANFEILIAFRSSKVAFWLLNDIDNEEVGEMISEGLMKLGSLAVNDVIAELEKRKKRPRDVTAKERLIKVLGGIKSRKAAPILEELTKDDSNRVRDAADFALKQIRGF